MPTPQTKYRPYLTLSQLKHIQQCMLAVKQQIQVDQETVRYLNKFIRDIEKGDIKPNHTTNPRPTLLEKLGFSESPPKEPTQEEIDEAMRILDSGTGSSQ